MNREQAQLIADTMSDELHGLELRLSGKRLTKVFRAHLDAHHNSLTLALHAFRELFGLERSAGRP